MKPIRNLLSLLACAAFALAGCSDTDSTTTGGEGRRTVVIGFLGKSQSNDVFRVAEAGARDAARELGEKYGVNVEIEVRTPTDEDPTRQAEAIEALTRKGVDAIAVSASEANTLVPAINKAVEAGIPVMTFDSDVPESKRFAFYGCDDQPAGERLAEMLAQEMNQTGTVAIIAGNESAPNLQKRVTGVKQGLSKYPNMKLLQPNGVFYHQETPEKAAEAVAVATNANPAIEGWAFIGGWPLFTSDALPWEPGQIKVVSWDALPAQLGYLRSGHVKILLAQDCYGWGHKSVETLLEKVINDKTPEEVRLVDPLQAITLENVDEWEAKWEEWLPK